MIIPLDWTGTLVPGVGKQWAVLLGAGLGVGTGVLAGRWSVLAQQQTRVIVHEVRRRRRLRKLRRDPQPKRRGRHGTWS